MLDFPENFFEKEIREDFAVDATMKAVWAAELEVLNEIAIICERHGLTWYMMFGSLLGAVRHQGFIPWDDDIDICLKRADYMQLLTYLPQELPEGYHLKSPMLEEGYSEYQSCVTNSDSISIEPEHLKRFHGCPFVVGIDIFPMDGLESTAEETLQLSLFKMVRQAAIMAVKGEAGGQLEELLSLIERECDVTIERTYLQKPDSDEARIELASGLWGLANELAMCGGDEASKYLVMYLDYFKYHKFYKAEWFDTVKWLPFENVMVPVPGEYDKVLRAIYGDYTIRARNAAQHGYPFYKEQLEQLRKRLAEKEE